MIRWKSNNQRVADREIFTGRIRGGQLEIVPDPKTGEFVPVYLDAGQSAPPVNTAPVAISPDPVTIIIGGTP